MSLEIELATTCLVFLTEHLLSRGDEIVALGTTGYTG